MAGAFVVIAEFSVGAEGKAEFLELCAFDSVRSTTDEAGCSQFDVVTAEESPEVVILYEVYADRAAFDAHMQTPHYAVFAAGVERLGVTKTLVRFLTRQAG
jgi:quinol monooxygenase YgiN